MFLYKLFSGKAKLWQAWWLSVVLGIVINICFEVLSRQMKIENSTPISIMILVLYAILFIYMALYPYVIWKCSGNAVSKGWSSIARILITLAPCINASKVNSNIKGVGGAVAILCTIAIILVYITGKISKSQAILKFNHNYVAPFLLMIGNSFAFLYMFGI